MNNGITNAHMYIKQSKKMLALDILDILRRYTDADHSLSQKQIEEILRKDYDMAGVRRYWNRVDPDAAVERTVVFRTCEEMIPSFVDRFGEDSLRVGRLDDGWLQVSVRTNYDRALDFAMRNTMDTAIVEPKALRDRVVDRLRHGLDGYNDDSFGKVG